MRGYEAYEVASNLHSRGDKKRDSKGHEGMTTIADGQVSQIFPRHHDVARRVDLSVDLERCPRRYSPRRDTIGSTRAARRAGM